VCTAKGNRKEPAPAAGARVTSILGIAVSLVFLAAVPASASYEQVSTFGGSLEKPTPPAVFPEKAQLGGASGMAVNVSGAGGVPAGTVYVAALDQTHPEGFIRIVRFDPNGSFRMQWTMPSERCGTPESLPACAPHPSAGRGSVDVDVDQSTGNVYAFNGEKNAVGAKLIQVFNATGTELITEFGERTTGEATAASPGKLHGSSGLPGGIAVDDSGDVYVFDLNAADQFRYRLMVFRPETPGDYTHYVYAGESEDVDPGTVQSGGEAKLPSRPVVDAAGNLYVAGENSIQKLDPSTPTAPPLCTFLVKNAGIRGMNVNPETGEVFYYNYKDRKVHQLSPCTEGEFTEIGEPFSPSPKRGYIEALAVNPTLKWEASRPQSVIYGATPEAVGEAGGGEEGQSALGYIFAPPLSHEPVVEAESVSGVGSTTATLNAQVNPNGASTDYVFQYITQAAYEANEPGERFSGAGEAPLGGALLGGGQASLPASAVLSNLWPDTAYRYRVVATSSEGADAGEAEAFHTFPEEAPGLSDRRAYELVSPVDKDGGEVFPINPAVGSCHGICKPGGGSASFPMQSSSSGEALVYEGSAFSFNGGAVRENEYLSRRTASGWQTTGLSPSAQGSGEGFGFKAFDAELTKSILYQGLPALAPEAPEGYFNLYRQPTADPLALSPLLEATPPNRLPGPALKLTYAGASADLSRIFFEANDALTEASAFAPEAEDGGESKRNLYEWQGGQLRLVNVKPGNAEAPVGAAFGRSKPGIGTVQAVLAHAISDDGSRVFWSDESGQVYLREDAQITKPIATEGLSDPGKFLAASADGERVLLANGHLHSLADESTTDLTQGKGGFEGILGQSEDLSSIYFVDTAILTGEEENDHGDKAEEGKPNLYAWAEGTTTLVATLLASDSTETEGDWAPSSVQRSAEASPEGRWLAFQSQGQPTGYDNTGLCKAISGTEEVVYGPCTEVFLYDSLQGKLSCPSCRLSGERPIGASRLSRMANPEGSLSQPRYLLDSGRLYFDSRDSLSLFDTNEGVEDVYQYEPQGLGTCARAEGCASLISAGHEPVDSNFLAADPFGENVFFTTRDQLSLKDRDELIDVYVAREGGGIPGETEVARSECQGEACQVPASPPNDPPLASSSFKGAGNVDERKPTKKHRGKKHRKARKARHKSAHKQAKHNRGGGK
jgi:hypothetical protein